MRRALPLIPLLGLVLSSVALAGCLSRAVGVEPTSWQFQNRTEVPITVTWDRENGEHVQVAIVEAWGSRSVDLDKYGAAGEVCADGEFVFRDAFGVEVMRGPVTCDPWIIEAA